MNYPFLFFKTCIYLYSDITQMKSLTLLAVFILSFSVNAQKDSLQLGDKYAEDQLYISVSYAQFFNQPKAISRSGFSYALSTGFIKDFILNKKGNISIAAGIGYGFDFFNHNLKVEEVSTNTVFNTSGNSSNVFKSHNLEFPIEFRWRTSNAIKYDFWRVYGGIKFLYNLSNSFKTEEGVSIVEYKNVSSYNKLQYGLTLSAGFEKYNFNLFYNLTPIFEDATFNGEQLDTSIIKFGLIFYIL